MRFVLPVLAAGLLLAARIAGADERIAPPYDLYETRALTDAELKELEIGAWGILHQERVDGATWMLLALPDGRLSGPVAGSSPAIIWGANMRAWKAARLCLVSRQ